MVDVADTTIGEWLWLIVAQEDERMDGSPIHPYIPLSETHPFVHI